MQQYYYAPLIQLEYSQPRLMSFFQISFIGFSGSGHYCIAELGLALIYFLNIFFLGGFSGAKPFLLFPWLDIVRNPVDNVGGFLEKMGLVPSRGQSLRLILPLGGIQLNLPKGRYISNHHQKNQKPSFNYSILYHYFFCTIFCTRFFRSFDFYNTAHEQFHAISLSTTIIEAKNAFQYIHRILLIICFFFQLRYIVHHHTIYVLFLVRFYYFGRDRWRNIFVPDRIGNIINKLKGG